MGTGANDKVCSVAYDVDGDFEGGSKYASVRNVVKAWEKGNYEDKPWTVPDVVVYVMTCKSSSLELRMITTLIPSRM